MINFSIDKKTLKLLSLISIFLISIIILLTFFFKNTEENKLNNFSKKITSINSSLKFDKSDIELNFKNTKEILNKNISSLSELNSNLDSLTFKESKYTTLKSKILNYLSENINLYNSIISIIDNKNNENFEILYKNLIKNEKNLINESNDLINLNIRISVPKNLELFFLDLNSFLNESYKSTRENDIINAQKKDFFIQINDLSNKFSTLKEDTKDALKKIREDNRDLSIILLDINKKRSYFSKIKDDSLSISIPVGAETCYDALQDVISSYNSYINSLEKSVENEMKLNKNSNFNFNSIDKFYIDTFDKYDYFLSCFDNFEKDILSYKN